MAKKNQVYIDIIIDDKGTTKRVAVNAKKLGIELDKAANAATKTTKGTDKLTKSQKNLDRNMRGTAKMSSNSTKNFSKMQQGMGGLVAAYATLAAQVFAVSAAFQFLQGASNIRNLIDGQEALGAVTGTAYKTITQSIISATDAQLNYSDAAKAAAIGTAAGLTAGQLEKLGTVAKNASFALGRDLTDSFNRLVRGVTKAEPELLDELGIILRLEAATKKYAAKMDLAVGSLTAFQRSQAVANEVLEQGTRKFAMIEAMMSKDAAALAQFTKSFDDLMNSFKTGVINGLGPILQFLSKNTSALVASLALLGTPILRAILPAFDEWEKKSDLVYRGHEEDAAKYMDDQFKQAKALEKVTEETTGLAKANEKVAKSHKKKTDKGGIGFVSGGASSPQARAAAKKGLALAQADLQKHTTVQNGIFKGYTAKQIRLAQQSYNRQTNIARGHFETLNRLRKMGLIKAKIYHKQLLISWQSTMAMMTKFSKMAAKGIDRAMKMAGFIGIVIMIAQGLKMVYDKMFPITERAQKQLDLLGEMQNKYKDLGEEMQNAADARKNLTVGSQDATNIGQVMQSANVEGLLSSIDSMQGMDKTTKEFKEMQSTMTPILWNLTKINPEFARLMGLMNRGIKITKDQRKELILISDRYTELGLSISNLPETINKANEAFDKLFSSLGKENPLDSFLQMEQTVIDVTKSDRDEAKKKGDILAASVALHVSGRDQQIAADDKYLAGLGRFREQMTKHFKSLTDEQRAAVREAGVYQDFGGAFRHKGKLTQGAMTIVDEEGIDEKNSEEVERLGVTRTIENEQDAEFKRKQKRHGIITKLRNKQVKAAEKIARIDQKATQSLVRGVTLQGKLNNLVQKRLMSGKAVAKAQGVLDLATARRDSDERTGKDSLLERQHNDFLVTAAEKQLLLEQTKQKLQDEKTKAKEREVALSIQLLNINNQIVEADRRAAREKATREHTKNLGGQFYTGASVAELKADIETKKLSGALAAAAYVEAYEDQRKELTQLAMEEQPAMLMPGASGKLPLNAQQELDITGQAGLNTGTQFDASERAADDITAAERKLELLEEVFDISRRDFDKQTQILAMQHETFSLTHDGMAVHAEILRLKELGLDVSQEEKDEIVAGVVALTDAQRMLEHKTTMKRSLEDGLAGAFEGMITGAKNAKEAFADMARSMLGALAKIIAQELALRAIRGAVSMFGFADGGITPVPSLAKGGYTSPSRNYSRGGTARGAQSGYNAVLHGNEAVVPLPDNRSIPVTLNGGGGQNNNVVVNVSMGGSGQSQQNSQGDSNMAANIGKMVAGAVQEELQYQKRSGGILNPYGAS